MDNMITCYHGTSGDVERIKRDGLRPLDVESMANLALKEAENRHLPKWIVKAIEREKAYRIRQIPSVHVTLNEPQAELYSQAQNGEFFAIVRALVRKGLRRKVTGNGEMRAEGKRYVVVCKIPMSTIVNPYVKDTIQDVKDRVIANGLDWNEMKNQPWDIQVDFVPPENIIQIKEVPDG